MNPFELLRDTWYFFSRNVGEIVLLCLPTILIEAIAQQGLVAWLGPDKSQGASIILSMLFYPLYVGALIIFVDSRSHRIRLKPRQVLEMALFRWPSFAVLAAISTLLIMVGAWMLIIPGLYVMIKLAFAEYLLVLEGKAPLDAIKESFALTRGHFWSILACVLLVMGPIWLVDWFAYRELGDNPDPAGTVMLESFNSFFQLFVSITLYRMFTLVTEQATEQ
ncbi:YciC family protein [Pseudomonas resinovorans]|uniref:YciC family protein n=1 Tax=Metapseudomonas resinovorans TaxID=53412 RepID=UPI00237F29DE|nr:YciC family protein [Pseudomonas resinovorans]MDE3738267.1 YciC family protein [Pseudomonas resinovorans]